MITSSPRNHTLAFASHRLAPITLELRSDRNGATRASPRRLERGQLGADPARQGALLCVSISRKPSLCRLRLNRQ